MSSPSSNLVVYSIVAVAVVAIGLGIIVKRHPSTTVMVPASPTSSSQATADAQSTATNAVSLQNFAFLPASITVKAGTKVTWTNQDDVNHSVINDMSGTGPASSLFGRDATYSYTFTTAGTYTYHCQPHPYMHGTVIVTN